MRRISHCRKGYFSPPPAFLQIPTEGHGLLPPVGPWYLYEKSLRKRTVLQALSDTPEDVTEDFTDIMFLNKNINKKDKLIIRPDTTMIVVHQK